MTEGKKLEELLFYLSSTGTVPYTLNGLRIAFRLNISDSELADLCQRLIDDGYVDGLTDGERFTISINEKGRSVWHKRPYTRNEKTKDMSRFQVLRSSAVGAFHEHKKVVLGAIGTILLTLIGAYLTHLLGLT